MTYPKSFPAVGYWHEARKQNVANMLPAEKQHCSRVDWEEYFQCKNTAASQRKWERCFVAYRMHYDAGMTQKEIAKKMGVSGGRAWQMIRTAKKWKDTGRQSPAEKYIGRLQVEAIETRFIAKKMAAYCHQLSTTTARDWLLV